MRNKHRDTVINIIKHIVRWVVGIVLVAYIGIIASLNIPFVQRGLSGVVSRELSAFLGADVSIGNINIGLLNRIIVSDLSLHDQHGNEMLRVARFSAKYDIGHLLDGRISISTVQLFGFNVRAAKYQGDDKPNFQFLIDKFASNDDDNQTRLDLRINSLLLRRGKVAYDEAEADTTPQRLNLHHLDLRDIRGNISLKALRNDSINMSIRHLSLNERNSGLALADLDMRLIGDTRRAVLDGFRLEMPQSTLLLDTLHASYDSIGALANFADNVRLSMHILPSDITPADIQALVPGLSQFKDKVQVEIAAQGTLNDMECTLLSIDGNHLRIYGNGSAKGLFGTDEPRIRYVLEQAYADSTGVAFLTRNFSASAGVPASIRNMGRIDFSGSIEGPLSDLTADGTLTTDIGRLTANVRMASADGGRLKGTVQTDAFDIGRMLGNSKLEDITFSIDVDGHNISGQHPDLTIRGVVDSLQYSGYTYRGITLDGDYRNGGFDGRMALDDDNAKLDFIGSFSTAGPDNMFRFHGDVEGLRPTELNLSDIYADCDISFKINADFTGSSIDDMIGRLSIDSLLYNTPERIYTMDSLSVTAHRNDGGGKRLLVQSEFMRACIEGDYSYRTLQSSIMRVLSKYMPGYFPGNGSRASDNDFTFDLTVSNTDLMSALLHFPLNIQSTSTLKGFFDDRSRRLHIEGYFPRLRYDERQIESGVLRCYNDGDRLMANVRFNNIRENDALNVAATATAANDSIDATLNWGNNGSMTFSGRLSALISLDSYDGNQSVRQADGARQKSMVIDIHPSSIILNDTLWDVQHSRVTLEEKRTVFDNLMVNSNERHLQITGTLSAQPQDSLIIDMNKMNIRYIFDIADLGVSFDGIATGRSVATGLLSEPFLHSELFIENFGTNDSVVGDMNITGEWYNQQKGLYLDADIREKDIAHTVVNGYIYPLKPMSSLDLHIKADRTNVGFLQFFLKNITPEFHGRVSGDVDMYGKFKALTLNGDVYGEASLKLGFLNTTYTVRDSIMARPEGLYFNNTAVYDERGTRSTMNGEILWTHFSDVRYNLNFDLANMLVMNTSPSADYAFYGTVYGTGNLGLSGDDDSGMNIDVNLTTNRNTTFSYVKDGVTTATASEFVHYVDRTPRRAVSDSIGSSAPHTSHLQNTEGDIRLNILADITPDALIRIVMDPITGDAIISRGTANLRVDWYNKGNFNMFGTYRMSQGTYKMSIQEIIRKDFVIQDGSTMTFAGDPFLADLALHTKYQVNSVSLNDLVPNASSYISQTTVRVDCLMDMSGSITSPQLTLGLELPLESDEIQALINNYIPTEEQMNMQILYLLSIGKFYTPDYVNVTQNSNVMSSVVSSTLSGQLNNALSAIINSDNWNFGTNFSTGQDGWTDMEFEGILSGTLLNNRLIVNGNFGYRDNQMSNTNFVGDFDAQLLLTPSGDIRLKAYNETNDRYFTRTNLTTQGIGIIFRKDFDKWSDILKGNRIKLGQLVRRRNRTDDSTQPSDSTSVPATRTDAQPADSMPSSVPAAQQRRGQTSFVTFNEK